MAFLGQEEQLRELQDRFRYLYVILFIGIGILLARLTYLQVLSGDKMRQYSEENRIKRVRIPAPRGMVFDRRSNLLLDNRPSFDVEITPQYLRESGQKAEVIERLSKILGVKPKEIQDKLDKAARQASFIPVKIKTDLKRDEVAELETWKLALPGVSVEMEIERTNLYGDVAAHFLGYIGRVGPLELPVLNKTSKRYSLDDMIGKGGIEKRLEDTLRGVSGEELIEVDALGRRIRERVRGRVLAENPSKPAAPGQNLVLTVDQDLQLAATKAFGENSGGAVAIDPRNGEILAMVSRPAFDPTEFSRTISAELWKDLVTNERHPLSDKTIQDHYSPGSTFKILTAIAALEEGVIDEKTVVSCGGSIQVGNRAYHCWNKHGHGNVNVVSAITESCDVFFYRVAQKLKSVDDIAKWATRFGFGKKSGIELSHEVPGLVPTEAWKKKRFGQEWTGGETLSVAIGQSFLLTTPIQLTNFYATLANGGILYRPHYMKAIQTPEGKTIREFQPEIMGRTEIHPKTVELVKKGLWGVLNTQHGTAYSQRLPGMGFVGKTGTVQVIGLSADKVFQKCENMKYRFRHHGLFVGFAPIEDPVIAVGVIAEHACHGASGAGPVVRAVIKTYLEKYYPEKYGPEALKTRLAELGEKAYDPPSFAPRPGEDDLVVLPERPPGMTEPSPEEVLERPGSDRDE